MSQAQTLHIVADENIPLVEEVFAPLGSVTTRPGRSLNAGDVRDADALIVRSVTPVNAELLRGSRVRFVGTCTIGTDHLDIPWLEQQGLGWASAPGCNANSVVEYVFSALSALGCNWRNKRVGIIGCGNVGGALYRKFTALGVGCSVFDPFLSTSEVPDLRSLEAVLGEDIVCLHAPLTRDGPHPSYHLLDATKLSLLKPGAVLLNAGRGAVIDNRALLDLLAHRPDLQVVLDVWEHEPNVMNDLLQRVALASPHIAGYSYDGKVKGTTMIYQALCQFLNIPPAPVAQATSRKLPLAVDSVEAAILGAYDVRRDDRAMREALGHLQGEAQAKAFDHLRKHYPQRLEFSHYQVRLSAHEGGQKKGALTAPEHELIQLGFNAP